MHVRCRENLGEFVKDVKEELVGEFRGRIEQIVRHSAGGAHRHLLVAHGELRISVNGGYFVTWHLDFGNHHDVVLSSKVHEFAHLFLGVKTTTGV